MQNEDTFGFLKVKPGQSILEGALHFLMLDSRINVRLVGFRNINDIDTAADAVESFTPYTESEIAQIASHVESDFNSLCTTCMYCNVCPVDIPVWKFVETANGLYFNTDEKLSSRLKWHWGTSIDVLDRCTECRMCEDACTQHLPILQRFEELKEHIKAEN